MFITLTYTHCISSIAGKTYMYQLINECNYIICLQSPLYIYEAAFIGQPHAIIIRHYREYPNL
jgi:hypothetical protein